MKIPANTFRTEREKRDTERNKERQNERELFKAGKEMSMGSTGRKTEEHEKQILI